LLLGSLDAGLRTLFAKPLASRAPEAPAGKEEPLGEAERLESVRLMRVNHCGEVCAQALYQGQALVARREATRAHLLAAAADERDHLAWCASRLDELGGSTSVTAPVFYAGSFALGALSGLLGDRWSMGFLIETERQVEAHLDSHLDRISPRDGRSRAILESMRADEIRHGRDAELAGGTRLPAPVQDAMRALSRIMTATTYRG
jgi:ubiquinone biosynthesis monooxygenase Coq7